MKKLIIVCGAPAAGKSTYASKLAAEMPATLLDIDTCTEKIIQAALMAAKKDPNDRDSQYFKENYREAIYDTLFAIANENLRHTHVIVVGPFTKEIQNPNWPLVLEEKFGIKPEIHFIHCHPDTRKSRLSLRANPRDQSKILEWNKLEDYYSSGKAPAFEHVFVEN